MKAAIYLGKKYTDGKQAVMLRVSHDYQRATLSLDKSVQPENFVDGKLIVKDQDGVNTRINDAIEYANNFAKARKLNNQPITAEAIRDDVRQKLFPERKAVIKEHTGFIQFARERADEKEANGEYGFASRIRSAFSKFERFHGDDIEPKDLTREMLVGFVNYMAIELKNGEDTRRVTVKVMRIVWGYLNLDIQSPFKKVFPRINRSKTSKVKALSREQFDAFKGLDLTGKPALARDLFLFSFYAHGLRISDVILLNNEALMRRGNTIKMLTAEQKTGKTKGVALPPQAVDIINRYHKTGYVFALMPEGLRGQEQYRKPNSIATALNQHLKPMAAMIGSDALTFHMARHTFASFHYEKYRNIKRLQEPLNHSSIATTAEYITLLRPDLFTQDESEFYSDY